MKKGYNVGFLLTGEQSCYNAAFGLATALRERGHSAMFLVNEGSSFVEYVNNNGFKVIEVPPIIEPDPGRRKLAKGYRSWKRSTEHGPNVLLKQGRLTDLIRDNSIDMFFLDDVRDDVNLCSVTLARNQIPTIILSYTFSSRFSPNYPPVFSSTIPSREGTPGLISRAIFVLLWGWTISTKGRTPSYDFVGYLRHSLKKVHGQLRDVGFERELRSFGWTSTWSEWKRRPVLPQVVFGHRMIDWPVLASNPERYYFGTSDLWRAHADFDWSQVDPHKPVVYCNISTAGEFAAGKAATSAKARERTGAMAAKKSRMATRYLEVVLDCFSRTQDWQLLVACGPFKEILEKRTYPPNIHLFERLPQLAVLEKADLAITWGGAGTIRECLNLGVPMLVFPAWTDQFGNAARVFSRKAGLRGNIRTVTPEQMSEMVGRVLTDPIFKASVEEMRIRCNSKNDILGLVDFVSNRTGLEL